MRAISHFLLDYASPFAQKIDKFTSMGYISSQMPQVTLKEIIEVLPGLGLDELRTLKSHVDLVERIRSENEVSTDIDTPSLESKGVGLAHTAEHLLRNGADGHRWTLADQALLASVILKDTYHQSEYSSRDINDIIEECGQPRIAHITSALSKLLERGYLSGDTKSLTLTPEGKAKARGLISMLTRHSDAA